MSTDQCWPILRQHLKSMQLEACATSFITSYNESVNEDVIIITLGHFLFDAHWKSARADIVLCRDGVRQDPEFRAKFHAMCANVGVDPLASNKGVWAQLLGFGDFYYELGVQIVEACLATRAYNGGLMDLPALRRYVQASLPIYGTHTCCSIPVCWLVSRSFHCSHAACRNVTSLQFL